MRFEACPIEGAYLIDLERRGDDRGFFARVFCTDEFRELGLCPQFVQVNNSLSKDQYTLRGMHYQLAPKEECKLVRCISGKLWDVILDLRENSPTYGQHFAAELDAKDRRMLLCPEGCAHGFLTLEPDTEVIYFVTAHYAPELERGVRWDDPAFTIPWPAEPKVISDKDRNWELKGHSGPSSFSESLSCGD